jgi:hypothetical protein
MTREFMPPVGTVLLGVSCPVMGSIAKVEMLLESRLTTRAKRAAGAGAGVVGGSVGSGFVGAGDVGGLVGSGFVGAGGLVGVGSGFVGAGGLDGTGGLVGAGSGFVGAGVVGGGGVVGVGSGFVGVGFVGAGGGLVGAVVGFVGAGGLEGTGTGFEGAGAERATEPQPARSAGRIKSRVERAIFLTDISSVLVFGSFEGAQRSCDFPKALPQEKKRADRSPRITFRFNSGIRSERIRFGWRC